MAAQGTNPETDPCVRLPSTDSGDERGVRKAQRGTILTGEHTLLACDPTSALGHVQGHATHGGSGN